jgi:hypothetical protein
MFFSLNPPPDTGIVILGMIVSPDDVETDRSGIGDTLISVKDAISDHENERFDQYSSSMAFSSFIFGADDTPESVMFLIQSLRI